MAVAIIALCLIALTSVMVATLLRLRRLSREIEKFVESARMGLAPLIHDISQITWSAKKVMGNIEGMVQSVDEAFETVRNTTGEVERKVRHLIESRFAIVSALIRGVGAGFSKYWRNRSGSSGDQKGNGPKAG